MIADEVLCHRDANTQQHCFTPIALSKAPRPWERRPSTPFAPRSKTHKVWKRYGLRSKEVDEKTVVSDRRDDNAAARAIKRLRADAREEGEDGEEGSEFFATRWDLNAEVGRRKISDLRLNYERMLIRHCRQTREA